MNFFDRLLLGLYSLSMVILFVVVGLVAAGWTTPLDLLEFALFKQDQRIAVGLVAIVFILISLKFLINSFGTKNEVMHALIKESAMGQVRITVQAMENIVKKSVLQVRGIREVQPRIISRPEGIGVFIHVIVAPDLAIPQVSDEIQEKVKENLERIAGVNVYAVKVLVENIATDMKVRDRVN